MQTLRKLPKTRPKRKMTATAKGKRGPMSGAFKLAANVLNLRAESHDYKCLVTKAMAWAGKGDSRVIVAKSQNVSLELSPRASFARESAGPIDRVAIHQTQFAAELPPSSGSLFAHSDGVAGSAGGIGLLPLEQSSF